MCRKLFTLTGIYFIINIENMFGIKEALRMSKPLPQFTSMDMVMTGKLIKRLITEAGYSVSEVQSRLGLSCPQPIYRWYKGQNLPSVDNLFILSGMLGLHMEDFLIQKDESLGVIEHKENKFMFKRLFMYVQKFLARA